MELSVLGDVGSLIADYIKDPNFVLTCVATFFVCESVFKIKLAKKYLSAKELTSIVIGAILGVLVIAPTVMGGVMGAIAGGITTLGIKRIDKWTGNSKNA